MANLQNLFNSTGKLYQVKPGGAINTYPNTPAAATLLLEACRSRIIYEAQAVDTFQFYDPVYGSRFYFNDSGAAPVGSIVGADEVTDYFIVDTRNDLQQGDIVDDNYDVTRRSRITVIPLVPETGTSDDLISLGGDLLVGDMVVLLPKGGGTEYTITIYDQDADGVVGGNFRLSSGDTIVMTGTNNVCLFIKNSDGIKEIARPDQQVLGVARKTLTSGGGNYYPVDVSTTASERIDSKRGLVILEGGATLAAPWNVFGEMVDSARSEGTTLEFILDSPLYTNSLDGNTLNIFGIEIPDVYCLNYNFIVRAWFNGANWSARMYVDQISPEELDFLNDGSDSDDEPFAIINSLVVDTSIATATKTITHATTTEGLVTIRGVLIMAAGVSGGSFATLGTSVRDGWKPSTDASSNFVCAVVRSSDYMGTVMIQIASDITIYTTSGLPLLAGDEIYISNIVYPAYNEFWP